MAPVSYKAAYLLRAWFDPGPEFFEDFHAIASSRLDPLSHDLVPDISHWQRRLRNLSTRPRERTLYIGSCTGESIRPAGKSAAFVNAVPAKESKPGRRLKHGNSFCRKARDRNASAPSGE
jgi:hypothetical protein